MVQWQSLLQRFLRNECSVRENKIVYFALRDGMIDDLFCEAIDAAIMDDQDMASTIDRLKLIPEDILNTIRKPGQKTKPFKRQFVIPEWLKIAAAVVITLSVSWFIFQPKTPKEELPLAMHTIAVPTGQTVNLTLADGTKIWLNSRTVLKYPSVFSGNRREVILDGEGFFEVVHDPETTFVVKAGGYEVHALGTQFNVEAYSQEKNFIASLLDGAVRVTSVVDFSQTVTLQPNTMARLHEGRLIAEDITDFNHYQWREGLISFKDMPFSDLMEKFEKCYGIKIIIQNNQIKKYAPTGKFRHADGIDYALRVLQRDFKFKFERDEEKNVIYIK